MFWHRDGEKSPLTPTLSPRGEGALTRESDSSNGISANSLRQEASSIDDIQGAAGRLVNEGVRSLAPLGGGRNSRVYRLTTESGRDFALKIYFQHPSDTRDRLGTEFNGLQFLWHNGVRDIAQPIAFDRAMNMALYTFIQGESAAATAPAEADIDDAVRFLGQLNQVKAAPGSETLAPASEACFSIQALAANLRARLNRLFQSVPAQTRGTGLNIFLMEELLPGLEQALVWCRSRSTVAGIRLDEEIPLAQRTLSPSDFGFHNALRRLDGRLAYVDFEYFGWDDPAKMVADMLLHPAMALTGDRKRRFSAGIVGQMTDIPLLSRRIEMVYPLFAVKWCLILLNEFLPENLMRRRFAHTSADGAEQVQQRQLSKARHLWQTVRNEYERFPYLH